MVYSPDGRSFEYPLLDNALDFVDSALERLAGTPDARDLKYAVIHLSAGTELVLKARLQREHWSLLFEHPARASLETYRSGDFSSASFGAALDRLEAIAGLAISDADKRTLRALRGKRNRLEHFGFVGSIEAVKSMSAQTLNFLLSFVSVHFPEDDLLPTQTMYLTAIRKRLSDFERFVQERWKLIKRRPDMIPCPMCQQEALELGISVSCAFCSYAAVAEEAADQFIWAFDSRYHNPSSDSWPCYPCLDCGRRTMIHWRAFVDVEVGPHPPYLCFACANEFWSVRYCRSCEQRFIGADEDYVCAQCQ